MSWAARANFCRGVRFSVGPASITSSSMTGIGGWGRDFPRLLLLLLLLVEEASSSFSFGGCFQTKKVLTLVQIKSRNIKIKSIHITCIFLLSNLPTSGFGGAILHLWHRHSPGGTSSSSKGGSLFEKDIKVVYYQEYMTIFSYFIYALKKSWTRVLKDAIFIWITKCWILG